MVDGKEASKKILPRPYIRWELQSKGRKFKKSNSQATFTRGETLLLLESCSIRVKKSQENLSALQATSNLFYSWQNTAMPCPSQYFGKSLDLILFLCYS